MMAVEVTILRALQDTLLLAASRYLWTLTRGTHLHVLSADQNTWLNLSAIS
jgi:hypothetical protein